MSDISAALLPAPGLYPQKYDTAHDAVFFIAMSEAGYRAASFLDDRILNAATHGGWLPAAQVEQVLRGGFAAKPLHFIFHTGHVGSTLLSRLIEEGTGVLGLREPLPLRTFAEMQDGGAAALTQRLALFTSLWRRGFANTTAVVVKATSSSGRLSPRLLEPLPQSRAVYLNLRAEPYLATLLAGANTVLDLRGFEAERRKRLQALLGGPLPPIGSTGELAAMSWLAESLTRAQTLEKFSGRVLALDFDALLKDVPTTLSQVLAHLGIAAPSGHAALIAHSPVLSRYSKAPDQYAYSPAMRGQLLAQARQEHAVELRQGLQFIERYAARDTRVAALL